MARLGSALGPHARPRPLPAARVRHDERCRRGPHDADRGVSGSPMDIEYRALAPELILSGTILIVLVVDVFLSSRRKWLSMPISLVGVVAAFVALLTMV